MAGYSEFIITSWTRKLWTRVGHAFSIETDFLDRAVKLIQLESGLTRFIRIGKSLDIEEQGKSVI